METAFTPKSTRFKPVRSCCDFTTFQNFSLTNIISAEPAALEASHDVEPTTLGNSIGAEEDDPVAAAAGESLLHSSAPTSVNRQLE